MVRRAPPGGGRPRRRGPPAHGQDPWSIGSNVPGAMPEDRGVRLDRRAVAGPAPRRRRTSRRYGLVERRRRRRPPARPAPSPRRGPALGGVVRGRQPLNALRRSIVSPPTSTRPRPRRTPRTSPAAGRATTGDSSAARVARSSRRSPSTGSSSSNEASADADVRQAAPLLVGQRPAASNAASARLEGAPSRPGSRRSSGRPRCSGDDAVSNAVARGGPFRLEAVERRRAPIGTIAAAPTAAARRATDRRRLSPCARWRSTSSVARPPSPARSSCSSPSGPGSSSTAACSRAARTSRSATGSRSPSSPASSTPSLLTHAHLDHCGLMPARQGRVRGPDPRDGRHGRAGDARAARLGEAPRGVRQARGPLGEAPPGQGRGRRPRGSRRRTRRPSPLAEAGETARRPRSRPASTSRRPSSRSSSRRRPATWPRDPEAELRAQPPELDVDLDEPLYTAKDAERALVQFRPIDYDEELEVAPGIHATFLDAGHILGSAIIRLRVTDREGGEERVIVCSGDLGRPGTPILRDPTQLTAADYVLVESTYGGREHEPEDEAIRILAETVRLVAEAKGVLLVPVVRDRAHAGGRLGAGPAHRARRDPAAAALPRLADGVEGVRHLPPPPGLLRRGDGRAPARRRHAARLPEPDRHERREGSRRRSSARRGRT